tara:strand:- start:860 stop:1537 length:678 start_codon:yes stop_codon:yes gene_type:complete
MVNVAIIPARAGSKRIINKNRKRINGDSLVERTYKFAKKINFLDDIIVSTDDPIILKTFKKKEDPNVTLFKRPKKFARSTSANLEQAVLDIINKYEKTKNKITSVLLLHPTSPFRSKSKIYYGFTKFNNYKMKKSVISVSYTNFTNKRKFLIKNKMLKLSKSNSAKVKNFQINGNFYIASKSFLSKNKSFFKENNSFPVILNSKKLSLDIDVIKDLNKARSYFKN